MENIIDFAQWYSGMERQKVLNAYDRYLREVKNTTKEQMNNEALLGVLLPSTKELRTARIDYNKRAYKGHFAGDEPERHWMNGVEWIFSRLKGKITP